MLINIERTLQKSVFKNNHCNNNQSNSKEDMCINGFNNFIFETYPDIHHIFLINACREYVCLYHCWLIFNIYLVVLLKH